MDILSIIGFLLAAALIVISIMTGEDPETGKIAFYAEQLKGFFDVGSIAIVLGGTVGVGVYIGAAILLKLPELDDVKYMLSKRK